MKPGDKFTCSVCGRTAFAKLEKILDGWNVKGEHLVCSLCGADAGAPDAPKSENSTSVSAGRKALDALFGNEDAAAQKKPSILDMDSPAERRFCRDCAHSLVNVFAVICTRKHCEVQPMDDCPDYEKRPEQSPSSSKSVLDFN
jgi:hypothetical protein